MISKCTDSDAPITSLGVPLLPSHGNCDIGTAKASADPTGNYGAEMALQSCPTLRKGLSPETSLCTVNSHRMQTTPGRGKTLGEADLFWLKQSQRAIQSRAISRRMTDSALKENPGSECGTPQHPLPSISLFCLSVSLSCPV